METGPGKHHVRQGKSFWIPWVEGDLCPVRGSILPQPSSPDQSAAALGLCRPISGRAGHVNTDPGSSSHKGPCSVQLRLTPVLQHCRGRAMKGCMFNIDNGYLEGLCRGFKNGEWVVSVTMPGPRDPQPERLPEPGAVRDAGGPQAPPAVHRLWQLPGQREQPPGLGQHRGFSLEQCYAGLGD
jgi:hypothetical protein